MPQMVVPTDTNHRPITLFTVGPVFPSYTNRISADELCTDDQYDAGPRITIGKLVQSLFQPAHMDTSVSRWWLVTVKDKQSAMTRQDIDISSDMIKISASAPTSYLPCL